MKSGQLYQGYFNASQYNYLDVRRLTNLSLTFTDASWLQGFVNSSALNKQILLVGRQDMNRAVQGDIVAVELFDEKDWKAPGDEVLDQDCAFQLFSAWP